MESQTAFLNRNVAKFITHPQWNKRTFFFDIMVAKTVAPFDLTNVTATIKLANLGYNPRGIENLIY